MEGVEGRFEAGGDGRGVLEEARRVVVQLDEVTENRSGETTGGRFGCGG